MILFLLFLQTAVVTSSSSSSSSSSFDPYLLDGGLVTAVAGRDYALVASDTRLTDGGYGIRSRDHIGGRIWPAHASSSSSSTTTMTFDLGDDDDAARRERRLPPPPPHPRIESESESDSPRMRRDARPLELSSRPPPPGLQLLGASAMPTPVLVGSAGCSADCESLRRRVRLELDALHSSSSGGSSSLFGGGGGR